MRRATTSARAAVLLVTAANLHAQSCTPDWLPAFGGNELTGPVRALTSFDFDGPGPEGPSLVVLQVPTNIVTASQRRPVVRWTETGWAAVGGSELTTSVLNATDRRGQRSALAAFDPDGPGPMSDSLYACGAIIANAPPPATRQIARFDGTAWQQVGDRFTSQFDRAYDLLVFDEDGPGPAHARLFVAGEWGTQPMVGAWNGTTWTDMPFPGAPPTSYGYAAFDLESWDPDGPGPSPSRLFVCGTFACDPCGAGSLTYLAQWVSGSWQPVGAGLPDRPGKGLGMTTFDADGPGPRIAELVIVSEMNDHDNGLTQDVTLWDGTQWTKIHSMPAGADQLFHNGPLNGRAWVHDEDGEGPLLPALFVARKLYSGSPFHSPLSRWDGNDWSAVGDYGPQLGININGSDITDAGMLDAFASFDFDASGAMPAALIVGGGITAVPSPPIESVCPRPFPFIDLLAINMIAAWNGEHWGALNNGLSWNHLCYPVSAQSLASLDPDGEGGTPESLHVHGTFATAGNTSIPLRSCVTGYPDSSDAIRYANARYSATSGGGWQRAGLDPDADPRSSPRRVLAVTDFDPDGPGPAPSAKHIAGSFDQLDATPSVGPLARWNSVATAWENFGIISGGNTVHALLPFDPDGAGPAPTSLFAAGDFDSISFETSAPSGAVLAFDGDLWNGTNFVMGSAIVTELIVFDLDGAGPNPARLIAAGEFVQSTSLGLARKIAQYDGVEWAPVGPGGSNFTGSADGSSSRINALAVFNSELYAAGNFVQWTDGVSPTPMSGIAKWNGAGWSPLPINLATSMGQSITLSAPLVHDLVVFDGDGAAGPMPLSLFAGGYLTSPGGTSQGIARWDGAQWHNLGPGVSFAPYAVNGYAPGVHDLQVFDDDGAAGPNPEALFIAGLFLKAGGDHSSWSIAKWGCGQSAAPPPCPGDANDDNTVNFADITAVLSNWLTPGPEGDANHDGAVNFTDITEVLANFLNPCP